MLRPFTVPLSSPLNGTSFATINRNPINWETSQTLHSQLRCEIPQAQIKNWRRSTQSSSARGSGSEQGRIWMIVVLVIVIIQWYPWTKFCAKLQNIMLQKERQQWLRRLVKWSAIDHWQDLCQVRTVTLYAIFPPIYNLLLRLVQNILKTNANFQLQPIFTPK